VGASSKTKNRPVRTSLFFTFWFVCERSVIDLSAEKDTEPDWCRNRGKTNVHYDRHRPEWLRNDARLILPGRGGFQQPQTSFDNGGIEPASASQDE